MMKRALDLESEDLYEVPTLMLSSHANVGKSLASHLTVPNLPLYMYKMKRLAYIIFCV